ncbi:phage late control D family protein [Chitinivorax sp. B]|uniref:phage late control D family protein n=1 Tax=Chitinivorax sp. B TaxID=2502235 RepID=UPI0010F58C3F|nr:phage late control D family protein [Chitinivorax sp. B]
MDQLQDVLKRPAYAIRVNGKDINQVLNQRLISLTLADNRGFDVDQLDITLDDSDGLLAMPPRGAKLTLAIGWAGQPLVDKGSYIVDEVEHSGPPDMLTIRARSADLQAGITSKRERSFHQCTVGDIVRDIAQANQLQPAIPQWLATKSVEHLDQTSESDANLLTRLAQQYDAIATVKHGRLIFCKTGDAESVTGKPFPTVTLTRQSGDQHRFSAADRNAYTAVKAYWHNLDKAEKGEVLVDAHTQFERKAGVSKKGNATQHKHWTATQAKALEPNTRNVKVLRHIYATEATALQGAKAAWQKLQRGVAEFSLTLAEGRPELFPELPAQVVGFKPEMDACGWIVSKVTHQISHAGFTSTVELEMRLEAMA